MRKLYLFKVLKRSDIAIYINFLKLTIFRAFTYLNAYLNTLTVIMFIYYSKWSRLQILRHHLYDIWNEHYENVIDLSPASNSYYIFICEIKFISKRHIQYAI